MKMRNIQNITNDKLLSKVTKYFQQRDTYLFGGLIFVIIAVAAYLFAYETDKDPSGIVGIFAIGCMLLGQVIIIDLFGEYLCRIEDGRMQLISSATVPRKSLQSTLTVTVIILVGGFIFGVVLWMFSH